MFRLLLLQDTHLHVFVQGHNELELNVELSLSKYNLETSFLNAAHVFVFRVEAGKAFQRSTVRLKKMT